MSAESTRAAPRRMSLALTASAGTVLPLPSPIFLPHLFLHPIFYSLISFTPPSLPPTAGCILVPINGVQWTWHCTPNGHHSSPSVTLFLGVIYFSSASSTPKAMGSTVWNWPKRPVLTMELATMVYASGRVRISSR